MNIFKNKRLIFFFLISLIFFPIFISVTNDLNISFSRMPGRITLKNQSDFYLGTVPISCIIFLLLFLFKFFKLDILKIEYILLLFCLCFLLLGVNFSNVIVIKNTIGLILFIISNIIFRDFFYKKINNNLDSLSKIFKIFFISILYYYS